MGSDQPGRAAPGFVRIIGGTWRRRRIELPQGADIRPTPDRVRETLFNWLTPALPGAACLDLFAGSGVLGFEALSRGADSAVLIDRNRAAIAALQFLNDELGAEADIQRSDAMQFLARTNASEFDIAFVDPPFAMDAGPVLDAVRGVMKPGALIYLEREDGSVWPEIAWLSWERRATAGAVDFGLGRLAG
jgi:16S rRNA (guanine966-N2)-methyltransferase